MYLPKLVFGLPLLCIEKSSSFYTEMFNFKFWNFKLWLKPLVLVEEHEKNSSFKKGLFSISRRLDVRCFPTLRRWSARHPLGCILKLKAPCKLFSPNFGLQSVFIENSFSLSLENSLTLKFFKVKKHLQKHCTTNCKTRCRISIQNKICLVTCRFDFGQKFYRDLWSKFMIKLQSVDTVF